MREAGNFSSDYTQRAVVFSFLTSAGNYSDDTCYLPLAIVIIEDFNSDG